MWLVTLGAQALRSCVPFFGSSGWARFCALVDEQVEDTAGGYGLGLLFVAPSCCSWLPVAFVAEKVSVCPVSLLQ